VSPQPRHLPVSTAYLRILRQYAARVEAELARLDDLLNTDIEQAAELDWLGAYLDLRVSVEILATSLWGLVTDPRLSTTAGPATSANSADPPSHNPAEA